MKSSSAIPILIAASILAVAPTAVANTTPRKPAVEKTSDISENPQVKAAQKDRDAAEATLEAAKTKNDKAAIDAAQKDLDAAEAKLKEARKAAAKAAKKPHTTAESST